MAGNDSNVEGARDRVVDAQPPQGEGQLLENVRQGMSRNEQLTFARTFGGEGQKETLIAPFKSKDGGDVEIVSKSVEQKVTTGPKEFKAAQVHQGEFKVVSTVGNDTQWKVVIPEERPEEKIVKTEVKEAVKVEPKAEGLVGDKKQQDGVKEGEEESGKGDGNARDGKPGEKEAEEAEAGKGDRDVADKDGDGDTEEEIASVKAGEDAEAEAALEATEERQGAAEAGAEVGMDASSDKPDGQALDAANDQAAEDARKAAGRTGAGAAIFAMLDELRGKKKK